MAVDPRYRFEARRAAVRRRLRQEAEKAGGAGRRRPRLERVRRHLRKLDREGGGGGS